MIFPKIDDYLDCASYFKDLYEQNQLINPPLSYRQFALEINWPVSYLNDVINKRRTMTLTRAFEFSRLAKFNVLEIERLV
ncbi:MAG: hypothetical protein Q7U04_03755, partial [Bacteriovorax sp.]|nr:hypothetical protein [Bacteriovorax sp.]